MKQIIKEKLKKAGASDSGIAKARVYDELLPRLQADSTCFSDVFTEKKINPFLIMEDAESVIVFVASYKSDLPGNISTYAYGKDYHKVLPDIAKPVVEFLKQEGYKAEVFADTGDLPDRHLAYLAGLGFIGKNHCLIHPEFGSFIFIGYILTDCPLEEDKPLEISCINCGKCIDSCPTDALSTKDFNTCLSYITQKKGELSEKEIGLIKENGTIWGCDICQKVCPHNSDSPTATHPDLCENLITNLKIPEDISNREFKAQYGDRAFSWRGKNILIRNQKLTD